MTTKLLSKTLLLIIANFSIFSVIAQTVTIPVSRHAQIRYNADPTRAYEASSNYNSVAELQTWAWTYGGKQYLRKHLFDFDITVLPANAHVTKAELKLYGTGHANTGSSANNAAWIEIIKDSWNASTVTWNNQPSTTSEDRVALQKSTSSTQNYTLDMIEIVDYMTTNPSPDGLMLKLQNDVKWSEMAFASPNHSNTSLHPKLVIEYQMYVAKNKNTGVTYTEIQTALDEALNGHTILIAPGIHKVDQLTHWKEDLTIEAEDPSLETILDGQGIRRIMNNYSDNEVTINNITFRNGNNSWVSALYSPNGAYINNCKFINNVCSSYGTVSVKGGELMIYDSEFIGNTGRAIDADDVTGTTRIQRNEFINNSGSGDLIDYSNSASLMLYDNIFDNNSNYYSLVGPDYSTAIYMGRSSFTNNDVFMIAYLRDIEKTKKLNQLTINGNTVGYIIRDYEVLADEYQLWVDNCLIQDNEISRIGIETRAEQAKLFHITFDNNAATNATLIRGKEVVLYNSIVKETDFSTIVNATEAKVYYTCVNSGTSGITGSVSVATGGNLYHEPSLSAEGKLIDGDACIGAGYRASGYSYDLEGEYIPTTNVDMGAFQRTASGVKSGKMASEDTFETEVATTISMYPNPTQGNVTIKGLEEDATVTVFNSNGTLVYEDNTTTPEVKFDLSSLPTGFYLVKIISGENSTVKTLVLK